MLSETKFSLYSVLPLSWIYFQGCYCTPFGTQAIYKNSPLNAVDTSDTTVQRRGFKNYSVEMSIPFIHREPSHLKCEALKDSFLCSYLPLALYHLSSWQWEMTLNTLSGVFSLEINKQQAGRHSPRPRLSSESSPRRPAECSRYPTQELPSSHYKATFITIAGSSRVIRSTITHQ